MVVSPFYLPAPRQRGGGTAEGGGRGAGLNDLSATTTKRRVRRPLHHATRGPPPLPPTRSALRRTQTRRSSQSERRRVAGADATRSRSRGAIGARALSNSGDFFSVILRRERSEPRRRRPRRLGRTHRGPP